VLRTLSLLRGGCDRLTGLGDSKIETADSAVRWPAPVMSGRDKNIVGEVLAKTYRIERFLGSGSVGAVYVARHVRSGGLYAVKVLHRRLSSSAEVYQRFQDEARLIATLRHPHILVITDFDRDENGVPFFVMDLLEGESLAQRLKHKETLPIPQTMDVISQVGSALHAAHRSGIVHRNLRPENIFLVRHDLGDRVIETTKVTDFGLACFRRIHGSSREFPPTVYHAPELLVEGAAVDGRADQWALAALAYRVLSGKTPFEEGTPEEISTRVLNENPRPLGKFMPELPPHVVAAIHRGMARRREDRYETTLDFVRAVSPKSGAMAPGDAVPENLMGRASPPSGRVVAPPPPPASPVVAPVSAAPIDPKPADVKPPEAKPKLPARAAFGVRPASLPIPALAAPPPLFEKTPPPMQVPKEKSSLPVLLAGGVVVVVLIVLIVVVAVRKTQPQVVAKPDPVAVPTTTTPVVAPPVVQAFLPDLSAAAGPVVVAGHAEDAATGQKAPVVREVGLQLRGAEDPSDATSAVVGVTAPVVAKPTTSPATGPAPTVLSPGTVPNRPGATPTTVSGTAKPAGPAGAVVAVGATTKPTTGTVAGTTGTAPANTGDPVRAAGTEPAHTGTASSGTGTHTGTGEATSDSKPGEPTKPVAPPEKSPAEVLAEAKDLYKTGEKERALELALKAAEKPGPHVIEAWRWVGSAACSIHDANIASRAYAHLGSAEHKQLLTELCQRSGLVLQGGQFINVE